MCFLRTLAIDVVHAPPVGQRGEEGSWVFIEAIVEPILNEVEDEKGCYGDGPVSGEEGKG